MCRGMRAVGPVCSREERQVLTVLRNVWGHADWEDLFDLSFPWKHCVHMSACSRGVWRLCLWFLVSQGCLGSSETSSSTSALFWHWVSSPVCWEWRALSAPAPQQTASVLHSQPPVPVGRGISDLCWLLFGNLLKGGKWLITCRYLRHFLWLT